MTNWLRPILTHGILVFLAVLTLIPFLFVVNNSFRTNHELYQAFFGVPESLRDMAAAATMTAGGAGEELLIENRHNEQVELPPREALYEVMLTATKGYWLGWSLLQRYLLNTLFVSAVTAGLVLVLGSVAGYVLSRYRFPGSTAILLFILSVMMFPSVLLLAPMYMVVQNLGLTNTYWALILPYTAQTQVAAIFIFKSFFDGLPEELFESARIDGAGHFRLYMNIVLPMSKPAMSVVLIINVMFTWNNFIWPYVVNTDSAYHVIPSGLYVLAFSQHAQNLSTLYAAYTVASIPLLLLFIYATRPFIQGITTGAFKA